MSEIVVRHYARPTARRHLWIGIAMAAVALAFAIDQSAQWLAAQPMAAQGLRASLLAGLATGIGALPVLFLKRAAEPLTAPLLGLAAGMMLAASLFSLLVPAAQSVSLAGAPAPLALATLLAGIGGAWSMRLIDRRTRHAHIDGVAAAGPRPQLAVVVAAIALHNVPEGLAVGVAVSAGVDRGMSLGIALQNVPEGWIVASALLLLGMGPCRAALAALGTGLVEPLGGLFGVIAGTVADAALPLALAAAAGAMIWVVLHELLPAARRSGLGPAGHLALAVGFAAMTALALAA